MKITYLLLISLKKNEVENVKFKKSVEYAVTGLSINQDIDSKIVAVIDTDRQHFLSTLIQKHVKDTRTKSWP